MKRIGFLLCLLALFVLPAFVAFGGGAGESQLKQFTLTDVDPSGQQVMYWFQHSGYREEELQKMIADFNETNQWNITVTGEYIGNYSQIYNKMITAIASDTMPDLVVAYANQSAAYQVGGALVDLEQYVKDPQWGLGDALSDFFEGFLGTDFSPQFGGMRLGFPPNRSMEVLFYNADIMKEIGLNRAPQNWDEFYDACKKATRADRTGYTIRTDASNVLSMIISRGGSITPLYGKGYRYNSKEMHVSMALMRRLYDEGYAKKLAERYGDQTDFANRQIAFAMGSTSGLPYFERAIQGSDRGPFEWSIAPIPYTTDKPWQNVYGASLSVCQSTPEKQLAAWIFIKWMCEPEQQARWVRISNYFPVRKSTAAALGPYLAENPQYEVAFKLLNTAGLVSNPPNAGHDEVRDAVAAAFNAILDGANIDKTLKDLDEEANEIYVEAGP